MDPQATATEMNGLIETLARLGGPIETIMLFLGAGLLAFALIPQLRQWLDKAFIATAAVLVVGEGLLIWFHWRLYQAAVVVNPQTGDITGRIAVPVWVESEKLYFWALLLAILGAVLRRHKAEILPGAAILTAALVLAASLSGNPFTEPLPRFFGQYGSYLQAMASGVPEVAMQGFQRIEGARQFFYNPWYMWVHPPMLFLSYAAFALAFIATIQMVLRRHSAYETTAYRWTRFGYFQLTIGLLVGFPWAIMAWQGDSWWWSGKVNMSIMMWLLYTAVLHARLYLRKRGMWKWVAVLGLSAFLSLVLTYISSYVVPGAHAYVSDAMSIFIGGLA
ncbi:MAG: cytochrome c biogenesis protein [Actinobacteria bacterium]|nr:cytochrome c biogenesis protein [Actinomycetota bacterium]MCL5887941.1 cytochrome c biogenesis protein [Actinomycetota bacterium]